MVLKNCQSCCGLQLLIIQGKQVGLSLLDLVKHFFTKLFSGLDLLSFFFIDGVVLNFDFVLQLLLEHSDLS